MLIRLVFGSNVCRMVRTLSGGNAGTLTKDRVETLRSRLYYQSKKRGILENDILIGGFADNKLKELNESELHEYDKIINSEHNDWDLYYFLTGKKELPSEFSENSVFHKIIDYVEQLKKQ